MMYVSYTTYSLGVIGLHLQRVAKGVFHSFEMVHAI